MKNIIKYVLMLLTMALLNSHNGFGQEAKSFAEPLITSFLREVYQTNTDALEIANRYIGLSDVNSEYSPDKRLAIAADHIKLLRKGETLASGTKNAVNKKDLSGLVVRKYVNSDKINGPAFALNDEQCKNTYVITKDNIALKYFYVVNGKIIAFDYMMKGNGGQAYFFSY